MSARPVHKPNQLSLFEAQTRHIPAADAGHHGAVEETYTTTLPVVEGGEGSRADFPDATSGTFEFGLPPAGTPEREALENFLASRRGNTERADSGSPDQQLRLEGVAEATPPKTVSVVLSRRNAWGRVAKPEYFGVDSLEFEDVTASERRAIRAERLKDRLFGVQGGESLKGLALNSTEYEAIVRFPGGFAMSVAAKTRAARQMDPSQLRRDAAAVRTVDHAIDSKYERAQKVITSLTSEEKSLKKLLKEMKTPGYAHMSEAEMRMHATTALGAFDNLLKVVALQANWTPQQQERAEKAMNARLFDSDYHAAMSYWKDITELTARYTRSKRLMFETQARRALQLKSA